VRGRESERMREEAEEKRFRFITLDNPNNPDELGCFVVNCGVFGDTRVYC